jgi:transposase
MELKRIAVDTSKAVFTVHGEDAAGRVALRRDLSRVAFEALMAKLAPCEVVLEACGASHHWGRRLVAMGHRVRLIPAQYVKPFVRRGKTDRADAAAIAAAASRPDIRAVPLKSAEQQAALMVLRVRELLVKQRTQMVNALRGHAAEFGLVAAKGVTRVAELLEKIESDAGVPEAAREALATLGRQIEATEAQLAEADAKLLALHKGNEVSQRLAAVPGIGPIGAITLALGIEPGQFDSGRHLAAWIGLTPREHSSGGKQRLGGISRAGHERLRSLLVLGATAVIRHAGRPGSRLATPWLTGLLARKPRKLAAVALANKMARIVWAMMARGEAYRAKPIAGVA